MKIPKTTTYSDLWTGDFDKDGVPNIDDQRPFDKSHSKRVNSEVSLSKQYDNLRARRRLYRKEIAELSRLIGAKKTRVKGMYSSIGKQMGRNIDFLEDMGGLRLLTNNKKENDKALNLIKREFPKCKTSNFSKQPTCIKQVDNKYSTLKSRKVMPYLGYHVNMRYRGMPYEIQIKCKSMQKLQDISHPLYKSGKREEANKRFGPMVRKIHRQGC
jgi:hypothetical protein